MDETKLKRGRVKIQISNETVFSVEVEEWPTSSHHRRHRHIIAIYWFVDREHYS